MLNSPTTDIAFRSACGFNHPMTTSFTSYSPAQLRQILALREQIEALQDELAALAATPLAPATSRPASPLSDLPSLAASPSSTADASPAKRRPGRKPRLAPSEEGSLFGLCNGAYLPRPIKRGRRKAAPAANRL